MTAAPLGDAVAHHVGPDSLSGHGEAFREATLGHGRGASEYFADSGLTAFADAHNGLCTFWLDDTLGLLQTTNVPLVDDAELAPSTDTNRALFGEFMGTLHAHDPRRPTKRAVVEQTLGNGRFVRELESAIHRAAASYLNGCPPRGMDTMRFVTELVAYVDSVIPGVLDLTQHPLTEFLASPEHGRVAIEFFEIASDVISNVNPAAMAELDGVARFIRDLLTANIDAIAAAPNTNLIQKQFTTWGLSVDRETVETLSSDCLNELATIVVAVYDTTAISLTWAIAYVEDSPMIKRKLSTAARERPPGGGPTLAELCALEAVRLGGSNPTALWRRVIKPFTLVTHDGQRATVPAETMLWLDRRHANHGHGIYTRPTVFDPDNIVSLVRSSKENMASLLSRNRHEINSFSMINTHRNPRKCPGRLFSVQVQACVLAELYENHDVDVEGIDLSLRPHSPMPRPHRAGSITITPAQERTQSSEEVTS